MYNMAIITLVLISINTLTVCLEKVTVQRNQNYKSNTIMFSFGLEQMNWNSDGKSP